MVFEEGVPNVAGRYRWRERKGSRVHVVTVSLKKGELRLQCSTMDDEVLQRRGEWSRIVKDSAEGGQALH